MGLISYIFYVQCIIFYSRYYFTNAQPLIGNNIRSAIEGEFPGVVSIQIVAPNQTPVQQHVCTGTLISREDVLTADHCLDDANGYNSIRISVGTTDLDENTHYRASWWISYVSWATQRSVQLTYTQNDIAIIRLTKKISRRFQPATIAYQSNEYLSNEEAAIAGWGKSNDGTTSPIMKTVEVTIISKAECNARMSRLRGSPSNLEEMLLCTVANPYAILGKGDSGGPLFYDDELVAINKATGPALDHVNQEEKINVHINLSFYRLFIEHVKYHM